MPGIRKDATTPRVRTPRLPSRPERTDGDDEVSAGRPSIDFNVEQDPPVGLGGAKA
jgi:hypothetical protein